MIDKKKDFRILQGVLSKQFKSQEIERERKTGLRIEKKTFREDMILQTKYKEQIDKIMNKVKMHNKN